jgi:hypothetical protein
MRHHILKLYTNQRLNLAGERTQIKTQSKLIQIHIFVCLVAFSSLTYSCKKIIQIDPQKNAITTSEAFSDSTNATASVLGTYSLMSNTQGSLGFGDGIITAFSGCSSDELIPFGYTPDFYTNTLNASTASTNSFWQQGYNLIYQTNVCIENIQSSPGLTNTTKNQLIGESKFLRAYFYFYLVNLYGNVPLILTSNRIANQSAKNNTVSEINQQIIQDLLDAQSLLRSDYSISGGQRLRANKAAAAALLAREYLYTGDWKDAQIQASSVINNSAYSLVTDLNAVFLSNSSETILQLYQNPNFYPFNATNEGYTFVGYANSPPNYYLNQPLLKAFENGDQRFVDWVDTTTFSGTLYYFPYKYKVGTPQSEPNITPTETYMLLRLAELYLIRAESEAHGAGNGINSAITDLNVVRNRAGLPNYSGAVNSTEVLNAIYHEWQIEFCFEWGHRWLDLRRTGQINAIMTTVVPLKAGAGATWKPYQALYPIPNTEIQEDHNLKQNPGY